MSVLLKSQESSFLVGSEHEEQPIKIELFNNAIYVLGFQTDTVRRITFRKLDLTGQVLWQLFLPDNSSPSDFVIDESDIYIVGRTIPDGITSNPMVCKVQDLGSFYSLEAIKYFDYGNFRQRLVGIEKINDGEFLLSTGLGNITSDGSSLTMIDSELNVIAFNRYELDDDQLFYGPFLDLNNTISICGDESDAAKNGFVLNVDADLNQLSSTYYFNSVEFMRDIKVDQVNNQRLILSTDELTLTQSEYTDAVALKVNGNVSNRTLEGPFELENSMSSYFFSSTVRINDTIRMAISKVDVDGDSFSIDWTKAILGGQSDVGSFNFKTYNGIDFIIAEARLDTVNGFGEYDIFIRTFDVESCDLMDVNYTLSGFPTFNTLSTEMTVTSPTFPSTADSFLLEEIEMNLFDYPDCPTEGDCQVAIFHSTQCNVINLNSTPFGFEDNQVITYSWTSPNTNFTASIPDTVWTYEGDLSEIILCIEASDGNCTTSACDTIMVMQPGLPIFENCPNDIELPYQEECGVLFNFFVPIAIDPCTSGEAVTASFRSDNMGFSDPYQVGITTITTIAFGPTGLTDTCYSNISVIDEIPPECVEATLSFTLDENGTDTLLLGDLEPIGIDECTEVFFSNPEREITVDCAGVGGSTIVIEDIYGNTQNCLVSYAILDTIKPNCIVEDQTYPSLAGLDSVQVFYEYEVEDNCTNPLVSFSIPDGSNFVCGSEQEIFMYVQDNFGNTDTCNFAITIDDCFDYIGSICGNVAEDLNCDGQISDDEFPLEGIEIALLSPADNDTLLVVLTDSLGNFKVDSLPPFTFKVRPVAIDGVLEIVSPPADEYLVTIDTFETIENLDFVLSYDGPTTAYPLEEVCYQPGDTVTFTWKNNPCLPNANIMLYRSICGNEMFFLEETGIDNDGVYEYVIPSDAPNQILEFALLGPGNTDFERYNCIEVHDLEIDFTFDLIGCKEFQFIASDNSYSSYEWTFGDGTTEFTEPSTSHAYAENEVYIVCLNVETSLGCSSEICKDLTVEGDCDDCNITFEFIEDECYGVNMVSANQNYELEIEYQWTIDDAFQTEEKDAYLDLGGPGVFEVCLIASDGICSDQFCRTFTKDTVFAELLNCPTEPIIYSLDEDCNPITHINTISLGEFCHSGDGNIPDIIYTRSDGIAIADSYPLGVTTVTASFTDIFDVTTSCSYDIVVEDNTPPTCVINDLINLGLGFDGQVTLDRSMIDIGSIDNCGEVEFSISKTLFDCTDIGEQEIVITLTDGTNETTCTSIIRIEDALAPNCTLDDAEVFIDENGNIPLDLNNYPFSAEDNCSIANIEILGLDTIPCQTGPEGMTYQYGIRATDVSGLTTECVANVLVRDTTSIECVELFATFEITALGQLALPIVNTNDLTDNCQVASSSFIAPETTCENIGITIINVGSTDTGGNPTVCPATITYLDRIPPTCDIADLEIQATEENGAFVTFDGFAEDPCNDEIDITYSMESGALYECGEYTITMTANDEHGNFSSCDFSLIVRDCDGCCLSESAFMDLTNEGFESEATLENGTNCIVQIFPPTLTECQIISQIVWGDGTVMNGQFPSDIDFTHEYTDIGSYQVCITMEETDTGECFSNQVCEDIEVTSDCSVITSLQEELSSKDVKLYPNPTNSVIYISSDIEFDNIQLININGQKQNIESNTQIDMTLFPDGIYLLRLAKDNGFITKKIIKL